MAKREILFNDEVYSIEESVIEASLAEMKSRLLDDYSGSGTTIVYDGTTINVDSTKLAAAASNLAVMLNRFAGSGANIVVNGVTYGIDSAKLNSANTKLHITLSDLQSGGGGSDSGIYDNIYPIQWNTIAVAGNPSFVATLSGVSRPYVKISNLTPSREELSSGALSANIGGAMFNATYKESVKFDDAIYALWENDTLGTLSCVSAKSACTTGYGTIPEAGFYVLDIGAINGTNADCLLEISNLNNSIELDYFPLQTVAFEDYTSIYPFAQGFASFEPAPFMPLIGETYIISWDGTEYQCVAKECDPETTAGYSIFFGECRDIGIIGNGEPFALGFGDTGDQYFAGFVATNSFATEHTIRIYQVATKNEYGFYFNKKYSGVLDGAEISFVFFEDGGAAQYIVGRYESTLPAGSFLYADHKIYYAPTMPGYGGVQVSEANSDGTQMIFVGEKVSTLVLDGASIDRTIPEGAYYYNFKTGTTYNEMPATLSEGDVFLCDEYCYLYGTYTDGGWCVYLATPEDCPFIQAYPNFIATDKNQTSYSPMLTSINSANVFDFTGGIFMGCSNLEKFAIPFGIQAIADNAFGDCINLTSITIPPTVRTIGHTAFSGCEKLTNIVFEGPMALWDQIYKEDSWEVGCPAREVQCIDGQVVIRVDT